MKNLITLHSLILLINLQVFAQTDGLNYQAVIIDPEPCLLYTSDAADEE